MKIFWGILLGIILCSQTQGQEQNEIFKQISEIHISGNEKTKENIVLRELPFAIGDSILVSDSTNFRAIAIQNLTNTQLFNFVFVHFSESESGISVNIKLVERWYVWPNASMSLAETNINTWWQNKDFGRINYGASLEWHNFTGHKDKLTLAAQAGWTRKIGANYSFPSIGLNQKFGLGLDLFYANNREINYASSAGIRQFFKDQKFIQEEVSAIGKFEFRPQLFNTHRIGFGFKGVWISDTVFQYSAHYLPENQTQNRYFHLSYGFRREKRDNRSYPLKGYLIDLSIDQNGLGLIKKDGMKLGTIFFTGNAHQHLKNRWYSAVGLKTKITYDGQPPYYNQRGLGYTNQYIRGYELYVIDGQHYALLKSNIKYNLVKKRTVDLDLRHFKKFDLFHYSLFLNVFGDAGYVIDYLNPNTNPYANALQYGYGVSLDFVSYYDIVVRFEGSINKLGQPGFYIHFTNPI